MRIAIVDCETTGLDIQDVPISIAVVVVALDRHGRGIIVDEWYGEQEPAVPISESAYAVHGRTLVSLAGKSFDLEDLSRTFAGCAIAIAHNAAFDARMISEAWRGISTMEWRCSLRQWPFPHMEGSSLDAVCRFFRIQRNAPHDAMTDAKVLLAALNQQNNDSSRTYLQLLLDREAFVEARVVAQRTVANAQQRTESHVLAKTQGIEFIGVALHERKLILSGKPDTLTPVLAISWYDERSLAACDIGTNFLLEMRLNNIFGLHDGKSILDAYGKNNDWLVEILKAGEEVGVTIIEKEKNFINFSVWKYSPDVAPTSSSSLDQEKPHFDIAWFDATILMGCGVGTAFHLDLQGDAEICGFLDGKIALRGDARTKTNQWIVQHLREGNDLTAVITSKVGGYVDFAIRKQIADP